MAWPPLAFGRCIGNTARGFLVSSKAGLRWAMLNVMEAPKEKNKPLWSYESPVRNIKYLLWPHSDVDVHSLNTYEHSKANCIQGVITVVKDMNILNRERWNTNFFSFLALSHPVLSKVMGSLTWCNESIINKIRDSFLNQVTLFRLSGYGAASLSHTLALERVRDLYLWAFLLQPCKAWLDAHFQGLPL